MALHKVKKNKTIQEYPHSSKKALLVTDPKQKAEILVGQFQSVFSDPSPRTENLPPVHTRSQYPSISQLKIELKGVLKLLKQLNISKANGPDAIPNILLKEIVQMNFSMGFLESFNFPLTQVVYRMTGAMPLFPRYIKKAISISQKTTDPFHSHQ